MAIYYELTDLDSANVVGFYESKEAALAIVRRAYERYGPPGIEGLALCEKGVQDEETLLGEGLELLLLATRSQPSPVGD
jgi:hypothetical protein